MTNFEKIKNMSKKELAEFINKNDSPCTSCNYEQFGLCKGMCIEGHEKWLESEITEQ
ncbi:TPA: hypothetical protein KPK61_003332 [Clostridioides difficile]|nr:hypothetical protein [Clostridioides difficile]